MHKSSLLHLLPRLSRFLLWLVSTGAMAQVNLSTPGTPVTETFNTLPASGSATFGGNTTVAGWYADRTGTGTSIVANTGSSNAGNLYSYGTGTDPDRALGTLGSGNAAIGNFALGWRLKNTTGSTITSLQITFTGEQWRNSAAAAQTLSFAYLVSAEPITTSSPASALPANYVANAEGDFTSPITGGTAGALDGNAAANRVTKTFTLTGLSVENGAEIMLRWYDPDHPGADHGLAIDDVSVTATTSGGGVQTPSLAAQPTTLSGFTTVSGTPSAVQTYTLTGNNLDTDILVTAPAGVQISRNGTDFGSSLTLTPTLGSLSATISVRLAGSAIGPVTGSITHDRNGTSLASVTVSGSVTDPNQITSIADARSRPNGTPVQSLPGGKLAGRVTVSNQFGATLYIQDRTGGISIFNATMSNAVQIGDSVQVTGGTINAFNQNKQIDGAVTFTSFGPQGNPRSKTVTVTELSAYEGQLVSIPNAQVRPGTPVAAADPRFVLTPDGNVTVVDGSGTAQLRISRFTNLPGKLTPGTATTVTGVVGRFNNTLQLLPRFTDDIPGTTAYVLAGGDIDRNTTFDVATWNIEWLGNTRNGPTNEPLQFNNAVQVLSGLQSDVIVLQEISSADAINQLVASLPGYAGNCSPFVSNNPGHEIPADPATPTTIPDDAQRVCVLYRTDVATLARQQPLLEKAGPLPGYPAAADNFWASGRYPYLWAFDVKEGATTRRVNVIGIHAKANTAPIQTSYDRRKYDVQVLYDSLKAQFPNEALVITGDFNDDLDLTVANVPNTESTYAPFVNDAAEYNSLTKVLSDNGFRTFLSFDNVIDHIVVSNELAPAYIDGTVGVGTPYLTIDNYGNTTSDHIPVVARFDLSRLVPPLSLTATTATGPICPETPATVNLTLAGGTAPYSYTVSGGSSPVTGNVTGTTAVATVNGLPSGVRMLTVTVADAGNRTITATVSVTVAAGIAAPNYQTATGQTSVTVPQYSGNVVFNADNCAGTLSWTGPNGQSGTGSISVPTTATGTFTYAGRCTVNGCTGPATNVTVTVEAAPLKLIEPLFDCATGKLTLRTTGGNGNPVDFQIASVTGGWNSRTEYTLDARDRTRILRISARQREADNRGWASADLAYRPTCTQSARLAVTQPETALTVRVLGNPIVDGQLTIDVDGAAGGPLRLSLTDLNGREVATRVIERAGTSERINWSVGAQPAGVLLLRVSTGRDVQVIRLVKP